ncbi:MAG TPA: BTAD domain-containing putative transcriptional regulator, partial [Pseudonocardiaceae bacterium]|nr:BTAD domain-containing putative transcriptional regulator [Pseudonocardiaceae bacterium]
MTGLLRFGLLGAFEVTGSDGERYTPTAPRLRTVLALLLMRPGAVVTVAELAGEMWGVDPPPTAANTVQVFVSRLRRLLTPARGPDHSDQVLRTWPGGYSLGIAPEQVDAHRFARLAGDGRRALAVGDAARSAAALRAALALWRGPALADIEAGEVLRAYAAELGEEHLVVQEQRIEADLALARDRELVGELRTLTANHPLREAFWRQLLLALYRSGRQAEALDAYQRLRRLLIDELGVEPGGDVRRVHHAILAGDPPDQLVLAGRGECAMVAAAASRLPTDIADFTGRAEALDAIRGAIAARGAVPIVAVSGKAGCGKTTLAVHAAHLLRTAFPDGQLYAYLRGVAGPPVEPAEVLARFLRALGLSGAMIPDTVDERSELFRARLAGRRVLVVLDDAAGDAQVRPMLPGGPGCAVLVTSRGRLCGLEGAAALDLPLFAPDEALELLRRVAGGERVGAEPSAAERIA